MSLTSLCIPVIPSSSFVRRASVASSVGLGLLAPAIALKEAAMLVDAFADVLEYSLLVLAMPKMASRLCE